MSTNARIAVVEDSADYRSQLVRTLHSRPGWRVVAECSDAVQAMRKIPESQPDLVLLDLRLPGGSAIKLIPQLRQKLPRVPFVMLTVVDSPDQIVRALESGACGYILKGDAPAELLAEVEDALAGGAIMSPAVARRVVEYFQQRQTAPKPSGHRLTEREWEILRLAARGRQHGEISMALGITVNTVKNHFRNIYEKLEVGSFTEALIKLNDGRGLLDDR